MCCAGLSILLTMSDSAPWTTCATFCLGFCLVMSFAPSTHGVFSNRDRKAPQIDFRPTTPFKKHLFILLGYMQSGCWGEGLHRVLTEALRWERYLFSRSYHPDLFRTGQRSCSFLVCSKTWLHTLHSTGRHSRDCSITSAIYSRHQQKWHIGAQTTLRTSIIQWSGAQVLHELNTIS